MVGEDKSAISKPANGPTNSANNALEHFVDWTTKEKECAFFPAGNGKPTHCYQRAMRVGKKINQLAPHLLRILLLKCCDVERNPGPSETFDGFDSNEPAIQNTASIATDSNELRNFLNSNYNDNPSTHEQLVIASWNAGGLRSKAKVLEKWCADENVDVVLVQEVQKKKPTKLAGYNHPIQVNRSRARKVGCPVGANGGVAIYTKKDCVTKNIKRGLLQLMTTLQNGVRSRSTLTQKPLISTTYIDHPSGTVPRTIGWIASPQ